MRLTPILIINLLRKILKNGNLDSWFIWIGKTYLAKSLYRSFRGKKIIVDGDIVRKYITYNLKYSKKDRKKNSQIISDLCQFLEAQGFLVICSILSIFTEHQKKNREKFKNYFQIFINSNISNLKKKKC